MANRSVLILGGYGTFGRHVAEGLARSPDASLTIAGRSAAKGRELAESLGADFVQCDASDAASLERAVKDAWLVINAAGPFQEQDYSIPRSCLQAGCHYVDLADGRDYVAGITQLDQSAREQGVFVCAGASSTPAITAALVADLLPRLGPVRSIQIALSAGNKNQPGVSTISAILSYVGQPVQVWQGGRWQTIRGWTRGEYALFPPPVGRRRVQVCDVPDLALFPQHFGAQSVVFKAGVELTILNYAIGALGLLKRVVPAIDLPSLARPLIALSKLFKPFGSLRGGCGVWVSDVEGRERSAALIAHENGPRIPAAPAILVARKLLSGEITARGAFPCLGFVSLAEFAEHLAPFSIFVAQGEKGVWTALPSHTG
jgi:saccharopine dehydrogenase-like NADP-dependent oxidoreductase